MALLRAREIASASRSPGPSSVVEGGRTAREQWLSSANGRLVGRPDLIRDNAVIDYKTGEVHEHGDSTIAKASYVRQLQIYAFLVKECTGRWPSRGVLLPMEGPPLGIDLEPAACERVAAEALELLDYYNRQVRAGGPPAKLAKPSPEACRWCPYQMLCPTFWEASDESWIEQIGAAAVGGPASAPPRPIHGGAALTLSIFADKGTGPRCEVALAPLNPEIHMCLVEVRASTRVRATGLARRADGTVVTSLRTVIARTEDLPVLVLSAQSDRDERQRRPAR